jgi:UDP-3-O-[3-hydroxymyristoyl] glucosamine N-acyltransferase
MKLSTLAATLGATLHGDPDLEITSAAGLESAGPGQITFVANPKYTPLARTTQASAVLVEPAFESIAAATLRIPNPYLAFARALELLYDAPSYPPVIHPTAVIAPTAEIGPEAHIGAYAVIGDHVVIGPHATLLPHVVIYPHAHIGSHFFAHAHAVVRERCQLGDHVILQNGVIIGADGFGFARYAAPEPASPTEPAVIPTEARSAERRAPRISPSSFTPTEPAVIPTEARSAERRDPRISPSSLTPTEPAVIPTEARSAERRDPRISSSSFTPAWYKILQTGRTVLGDHVEVQANSTIDRASIGETHVRAGAKIDNLVMIGHGSSVGEDTLLCSQVGLAGSTHVGRNVILAGQVGVAGHCTIGDGAIATAQSGIPSDVPPGATVSGYPAIDNRKWLRAVAVFNRLPDLLRDLRKKEPAKPREE